VVTSRRSRRNADSLGGARAGTPGNGYLAGLKYQAEWIHQQHAMLAESRGFLLPRLTTLKPIRYLLAPDWEPILHVLADE
jgi:hypothetical protein